MSSSPENKSKTFKIAGSDIDFMGGLYHPNKTGTPGSAAKKAAKSLFRMVENKKNKPEWKKFERFNGHKTIKFILRESTSGSDKKSKYYEAKVIHLAAKDHKTVVINGVEIVYTKKLVVKSCPDPLVKVGSVHKSA